MTLAQPMKTLSCNMKLVHTVSRFVLSKTWILSTITIEVCANLDPKHGCSLSSEDITGYMSQPGDIVIGGTFSIHLDRVYNVLNFTSKPQAIECQMFGTEYYQATHALIFAVDEINKDTELLPNVTLGFKTFDTCVTIQRAALGTLWMLSAGPDIIPNYQCHEGTTLAGIVGDCGSTRSILMAQILGLYRYPQISYLATGPILSERHMFPSFFRTIPSDGFQMRGLSKLISYFGWTWVGLLASDDDYGQYGLQMIKQEIQNHEACVAFYENILTGQPNRNAPHIARVIRKATSKVVFVIAADSDFVIVAEEMLKQNVTGITWVASEAWTTSSLIFQERFKFVLAGTIGFAIHGLQMATFSKYLKSLHPLKYPNESFIREFWEDSFACKLTDQKNVFDATGRACTGNENMDSLLISEFHRVSLNVYTAVYAFAWALQSLMDCTPGIGPFYQNSCANITSFHPWQLLHYIKNVHFKTKDGRQIFFDANGNPPPVYDIVNWHLNKEGALEQAVVGNYEEILIVDHAAITWHDGSNQVPSSKCCLSCPAGSRKVIIPEKPPCCYECSRCPQGEISSQTDAVECHACSPYTWSSLHQDRCLPRTVEFLSFIETLGCSLAATAIVSSLVPLAILAVYIRYKGTPVVKANNFSLSCLLLFSLFFCFLCSLTFIGYPQPIKCLLRQVAFGVVFSLCISCVLAKTIIVVIAFKATKPDSALRKWTGVKVSYCVITCCVLIQLCLCVIWLLFYPPFSELDTNTQFDVIIPNCNEGSPSAFWCMLGYLGLLATISFVVAFLARRLPDSFNEAKLITFSMLAFLSVWVSFIPAYLSTRGKYTVAMEVFAILSSSWAVVLCIFVPKCFIVLLRPNMNSREHLMGKVLSCK